MIWRIEYGRGYPDRVELLGPIDHLGTSDTSPQWVNAVEGSAELPLEQIRFRVAIDRDVIEMSELGLADAWASTIPDLIEVILLLNVGDEVRLDIGVETGVTLVGSTTVAIWVALGP